MRHRKLDGERVIGDNAALPVFERVREGWVAGAVIVPVGSVANLVEVGCTFKGRIEQSVTRPNAGLSGQLAKPSIAAPGRVSEAEPRGKIVIAYGRQSLRDARVAGEHPPDRRTRKYFGLQTWNYGLQFVVLFVPRSGEFPAQSVVQGQVGSGPPAVLSVETHVPVAAVGCGGLSLVVAGRRPQQKIRYVDPRFAAGIKQVIAVFNVEERFLKLSVMIAAPERQRMLAHHFAIVVQPLERILRQSKDTAQNPEIEVVQIDLRNTFNARIERGDAGKTERA